MRNFSLLNMSNLCNKCNVTIKITANTFLTECSHCLQLICQDCNDIPIKIAKVIQGNSDIGVTWKCINCRLNCIPLNLSTIDEKLINKFNNLFAKSKINLLRLINHCGQVL